MAFVTIIVQLLLTGISFTIAKGRLSATIARRRAYSASPAVVSRSGQNFGITTLDATSDPQLSSNWAGAVLTADSSVLDKYHIHCRLQWVPIILISLPLSQTYTSITGTFIIPSPSFPSSTARSSSTYSAAAWVGIDGENCSTALLQTGVDLTVSANGSVSINGTYKCFNS